MNPTQTATLWRLALGVTTALRVAHAAERGWITDYLTDAIRPSTEHAAMVSSSRRTFDDASRAYRVALGSFAEACRD